MHLKQKTVAGRTYRLKQMKSDRPGYEYEYHITEDGGMVEDPYYNRDEAEKRFEETVNVIKRGESADRGQPMFSMGGGFDPQVPDFGGFDARDDDDDSGGDFPWMP